MKPRPTTRYYIESLDMGFWWSRSEKKWVKDPDFSTPHKGFSSFQIKMTLKQAFKCANQLRDLGSKVLVERRYGKHFGKFWTDDKEYAMKEGKQ